MAKGSYGFDFLHRRIFQNQLRQRTECHFFTVIIVMRVRDSGQAVMHCVRRSQTTTFKTNTAQIGVRFNHALQRRSHYMLFGSKHRFFAFFQQGVVAQFSQCQRSLGALAARHGGRAATRAGTRFKPGCQRIADTRR